MMIDLGQMMEEEDDHMDEKVREVYDPHLKKLIRKDLT
jgi:hypothetical protein